MSGVSDFLAMGGYGAFVWTAYGVVFVVMVGLFVISRRRLAANEKLLRQLDDTGGD